VDELPEYGKLIHFHQTEAWFSSRISSTEDALVVTLARPVNANLELIPEKGRVKLSGHLHTTARLGCSRCLQEFGLELDETMELVLLRFQPEDTPEEVDLRPQDLDTEFYDGVTIDVDLIVAEQIFLALPQKPLCQAECRGLCSGCGADLNNESCRCEQRATGSAFEALRSLKIEH
jgi:uncharacterized protein